MQKSPLCIFFPLIPFNLQKIRANSSLSRLFAPFPTSIPAPSALIVPFLFFVQDYTLNDPDKPIRLNSEEDTRFYHCNIKTLNLLPSVMTAQRAKLAGMSETVFHRGDIVTECAHSNVSVLKDGIFYSHPNDELILRGIAKTHMLQACYRLGITVMEKPFTVDFMRDADEIIVTSSSNFCLHACEFEGKPAGGKDPATLKAIQDEVLKEFYDYTGCESLWG